MISRFGLAAFSVVITAAALWLFVTPQTMAALTESFAHGRRWSLGVAFALSAGVQWLRAWRFAIMTRGDLALPDVRFVRIAFQLNFFNFLLPFRLGELSYPVQMHRLCGQPVLNAVGVLILARLFDLASVSAIMLGAAAVLDLAGSSAGTAALWIAAGTLAVTPGTLVFLGRAARPFIMRQPWLADIAAPFSAGIDALSTRRARFAAIGLSFAVWMTFGALAILTANAVVDSISPEVALLGASAGNLAFALPINGIAGLGPSQAAWVGAVTQAGVPWEDAVVGALTLYSVSLASALIFGGIAMLGRGTSACVPKGVRAAP